MIIAAADVNPTETGPDIKSIKNPENKFLFLFKTSNIDFFFLKYKNLYFLSADEKIKVRIIKV